jgi:hypothetical protein
LRKLKVEDVMKRRALQGGSQNWALDLRTYKM